MSSFKKEMNKAMDAISVDDETFNTIWSAAIDSYKQEVYDLLLDVKNQIQSEKDLIDQALEELGLEDENDG